jgi:FkbM family methyltransferase
MKSLLSNFIRRLAAKRNIELPRMPEPIVGSRQLTADLEMVVADHRSRTSDALFFVQVGAFDGVTGDPLRQLIEADKQMAGIMIEPRTEPFLRLSGIYAHRKNIRLVNAAVAECQGHQTLYQASPSLTGSWVNQIASFDRDVLLKHRHEVPGLENAVMATRVPTVIFDLLLENVLHVDILQVDTEGYDAEILRMFDIQRRHPAIINFEHKHLSRSVYHKTLAALVGEGYMASVGTSDTLCYRRPDRALTDVAGNSV